MKKLLCCFMAIALAFSLSYIPQYANAAAETGEDGIAIYQSTDLKADGTAATLPFSESKDSKAVFRFELDTPSYISVNVSTSGTSIYENEKNTDFRAGIYYDKEGTSGVYNCTGDKFSITKPLSKQTCLEPGSYYIVFQRTSNSLEISHRTGTVSASVKILEKGEVSRPVNIKKAKNIKLNTIYESFVTDRSTGSLFYKLKLSRKGKVTVFTSANSVASSVEENSKHPYSVEFLNSDGVAKKIVNHSGMSSIEETSAVLNKGTYYVKMNFKNTFYLGNTSFKAKLSYVPTQPKVTSYKAGSKRISGTADKGVKVYAKIGGKTYSSKAGSNGKYSIKVPVLKKKVSVKVYAKNSIGSSASKTVKVK